MPTVATITTVPNSDPDFSTLSASDDEMEDAVQTEAQPLFAELCDLGVAVTEQEKAVDGERSYLTLHPRLGKRVKSPIWNLGVFKIPYSMIMRDLLAAACYAMITSFFPWNIVSTYPRD